MNLIFMTFFSVLVVQWENIYTINHSLSFSLFMYVYHSNAIQCQKQNLAWRTKWDFTVVFRGGQFSGEINRQLHGKYRISSYSFRPWIISSLEYFPHICVLWPLALCTVTFGFPKSRKNSFRGNYMRKYGSYQFPH